MFCAYLANTFREGICPEKTRSSKTRPKCLLGQFYRFNASYLLNFFSNPR